MAPVTSRNNCPGIFYVYPTQKNAALDFILTLIIISNCNHHSGIHERKLYTNDGIC